LAEVTIRRSKLASGLLASGDLAPHMAKMSLTKNPRAHASDHAAAIARWDDEGGAPRSAPREIGAVKKRQRMGRMMDNKQRNRIKLPRPKR
jgi:hypothetical protein